jgi:Holliday junction resolvase RusA-like endonuclease
MAGRTVRFVVQGDPVAQPRARTFTTKAGNIRTCTPNNGIQGWKGSVGWAAVQARKGAMLTGPLKLSVMFYLPRPKSMKGAGLPVCKPDCDNLIKGVKDALNQVLYEDDAQVVEEHTYKLFADSSGHAPGAIVTVEELSR